MEDYEKWQVEFEEVLNKDFACLSRPTVKNLIKYLFLLYQDKLLSLLIRKSFSSFVKSRQRFYSYEEERASIRIV